jgi:hypothetical protein
MTYFTALKKLFHIPAIIATSVSLIACSTTDTIDPTVRSSETNPRGSKVSVGNFKYNIGDKGPAGGWIFFVDRFNDYPSFIYLEAAPEVASSGVVWATTTATCYDESDALINCQSGSPYHNANRKVEQLLSQNVGMGLANTKAVIARHDAGVVPKLAYAAGLADSYSTIVNGVKFDDWFLPSAGEEQLMYTNLEQAGVVQFSHYDDWSSSEVEGDTAWYPDYDAELSTGANKFFTNAVRAIRAF